MERVRANGLRDNYINDPRAGRRAGAESFTFVSNGWLNKFDWILNVSYITSSHYEISLARVRSLRVC